MLRNLKIKNFSLIKFADVNLESGFTIITGETGAGKSMFINAIAALLGERVAVEKYHHNEKTIVEAKFDMTNNTTLENLLLQYDFDILDHEVIIRKEWSPNGKSRIFINDTPATVQQTLTIGTYIIDLHRQFDTIALQQHQLQLELYDMFALEENSLHTYKECFLATTAAMKTYQNIQKDNIQIKKELDYSLFLHEELSTLSLQDNEIENLEAERDLLLNVENILSTVQKSNFIMAENDTAILLQVKSTINDLEKYRSMHPKIADIAQRLQSIHIELKDINNELENIQNEISIDEERISWIQERLNGAYKLLKKHQVHNTNQLLQIQEQLRDSIQKASLMDEQEKEAYNDWKAIEKEMNEKANYLSIERKKQKTSFVEKVNVLLSKVGMKNAKFDISIDEQVPTIYGIDKITFLIDTNKTGQYKPIGKTASGGELSRLMLCIKSLVGGKYNLPTMVFDEIDTGISGETAIQVAQLLKNMSQIHQVICISHLPQVAGKAHHHLHIQKMEGADGKIFSQINSLKNDERVAVLAEMLSGNNIDSNTKKIAEKLMK